MVGAEGIGPSASFLSGTRSTTELRTHKIHFVRATRLYNVSGTRSTTELRTHLCLEMVAKSLLFFKVKS